MDGRIRSKLEPLLKAVKSGGRGEQAEGSHIRGRSQLQQTPHRPRSALGLDMAIVAEGRPFDPRAAWDEPLGGMQTAVIGVAGALAGLGHRVRVFANVPDEISHQGAIYLPVECLLPEGAEVDALITVRRLLPLLLPIRARTRILWLHDGPGHPLIAQGALFFKTVEAGESRSCGGLLPLTTVRPLVDRFFAVGGWQAEEHCRRYELPPEDMFLTSNGVDFELLDSVQAERNYQRLLYCSAPGKGLNILLRVWPHIRAAIPNATLRICSSNDGYGATTDGPLSAAAPWDGLDGVEGTAFVAPRELGREMKKAAILAYPNHEPESHSIAVAHAAAAGMAIVTSAYAGLAERIKHEVDGILIPGSSLRPGYEAMFIDAVIRLLEQPDEVRRLGEAAQARARRELRWDGIARAWTRELRALCRMRRRSKPDIGALNLEREAVRTMTAPVRTSIPLPQLLDHLSAEMKRYGLGSGM